MKLLLKLTFVFVLYIALFRFFYLEDGLSLIIHVCFPIIIGVIIASILNPLLVIVQKKIKNRYVAIILTFLIIIIILSIVITIITPNIIKSIKQFISDLPVLLYKADKYLAYLDSENRFIIAWLSKATEKLSAVISILLNFAIEKVIDIFSTLANLFLAIIISIYVLIDKEKIENWILRLFSSLFSKKTAIEIFKIIHSLYENLSSYIAGKLIASILTGLLVFVGSKYIIKTPYPAIDGVIIGFTNIIPYFGTFIGAIPVVLINLLYNSHKGFLIFIYILMVQQIDSLIIDPKILGNKLSLKPIIIISSIIVGGGLFGAVGLFFATPIAALIKSSIDAFMKYKLKENNESNRAKL